MLTYFQAETVLKALKLAETQLIDAGVSDDDLETIEKAKKHILAAIKDNMPIGEHEDDMMEESEPDQTVGAMRHSYAGLL